MYAVTSTFHTCPFNVADVTQVKGEKINALPERFV